MLREDGVLDGPVLKLASMPTSERGRASLNVPEHACRRCTKSAARLTAICTSSTPGLISVTDP